MLEIKNYNIKFNDSPVLQDINIQIPKAKFTVILGHSGSGKSVLSKSIIGLLRNFDGDIEYNGCKIDYSSNKEVFQLRKRIGMLFQSGALFDSMDVYQNIAFPFFEHTKMKEQEIETKVNQLLEKVSLPGIGEKQTSELSGGMKRRVAFARAIALEPEVLIYDEPTTGLDPRTTKNIAELIFSLHKKEIETTIVITHDFMSFKKYCEHLVVLNEGKCIYTGKYTDDVLSREDIAPLINNYV